MASPIRRNLEDLEPLGDIGGLLTAREDFVPNIQSAYGAIIQNAPDYQYFTAPVSNQGRSTASYGRGNDLVVAADTPIRLVNNTTGEIVYSGVGYEGAQAAIDAATNLSGTGGRRANWDIQVVRPGGANFETVSTERPDTSTLGILADIGLPIAGSLLAGPLGLGGLGLGAAGTAAAGAAAGSAASSVAQGRSFEDVLLRAAMSGAGSLAGSQLFAPGAATDAVTQAATQTGSQTASQAASQAAAQAATQTAAGAGDIIVTALGGLPLAAGGAFGTLATNLMPSAFDAAQLNNNITLNQQQQTIPAEDIVVTAQPQPQFTPPVTTGLLNVPGDQTTQTTTRQTVPAEDIVVTAQQNTLPLVPPVVTLPQETLPPPQTTTQQTQFAPAEEIIVQAQNTNPPGVTIPLTIPATSTIIPPASTTTSTTPVSSEDIVVTARTPPVVPLVPPVSLTTPTPIPTPTPTPTPAPTPPPVPEEDIVVTAKDNPIVLDSVGSLFATSIGSTSVPNLTPTPTPPGGTDNFLGTGLNLTQFLALTGLSLSAIEALLAGGGGAGGTPNTYTSPFAGTGGGTGTGTNFRSSPGITDYERYGFGPEASFFQPDYFRMVTGGTPLTTGTNTTNSTQQYRSLI